MNHLLETPADGRAPCQRRPRLQCVGLPGQAANPTFLTERARVEQSIRYMVEHLTDRLNIPMLASMAHVSPSGYFAMFKRQSGCAPIDLLIHLRMYRACALLDTTDLTVKELATTLGYEDAFYFSRLFKSIHQVAPTDYRLLPEDTREAIRAAGLPEICWPMQPILAEALPQRSHALVGRAGPARRREALERSMDSRTSHTPQAGSGAPGRSALPSEPLPPCVPVAQLLFK